MTAIILGVVFVLYAMYVLFLLLQWISIPQHHAEALKRFPKVSVIVPFKDEEDYLPLLLNDLRGQSYPTTSFEIIAVDDHSTDQTVEKIATLGIENLSIIENREGVGKKTANLSGINQSDGELIVTLDADMRIGEHWLSSIVKGYLGTGKSFLILPMTMGPATSFWDHLQILEFASLLGTGGAMAHAGDPILCNGGNLAFTRELFEAVDGYRGNEHISSGDDVFMLAKVRELDQSKIAYIHDFDAAAVTYPLLGLGAFLKQRIRWGGKTKAMNFGSTQWIAMLVFATNLAVLLSLIGICLGVPHAKWLSIGLLLKVVVDLMFILPVAKFYHIQKSLFFLPILVLLYPIYITIAAALGLFYKPDWKGREIQL